MEEKSGRQLSDMHKLWSAARQYQKLADDIDLLQPQKWIEEDPARLKTIIDKITDARLAQRRLLDQWQIGDVLQRLEARHTQGAAANGVLKGQSLSMVRAMRRIYNGLAPLNENDIRAMEIATSDSEKEWLDSFEIAEKQGRKAAFQAQLKPLETVFGLRRSLSRKVALQSGTAPSEVPLDEWNPWMRNKDVDRLFAKAEAVYPQFVKEIAAFVTAQRAPVNPLEDAGNKQKFSEDKQLAFFKQVQKAMLEAAGWNEAELKNHGVTLRDPDFQPNPFCWGTRREAWMTIENRSGDFFAGLGNTLHETGHLLYLLSLNRQDARLKDTPLGQINGYGVHEVAAMFFEQASADKKFWELITPMVKAHFGVDGPEWTPENLRGVMNRPNLDDMNWGSSELALMPNMQFRVMAERKILDGQMEVKDLPQFYADTMTRLTGRPHSPDDFIVDESHWFDRQTGYFPGYWIGALCGSRLHDKVDRPKAETAATLKDYLKAHYETLDRHVCRHASMDKPLDMIRRELGGEPADFLPSYMERLARNYTGGNIPKSVQDMVSALKAGKNPPQPPKPSAP